MGLAPTGLSSILARRGPCAQEPDAGKAAAPRPAWGDTWPAISWVIATTNKRGVWRDMKISTPTVAMVLVLGLGAQALAVDEPLYAHTKER